MNDRSIQDVVSLRAPEIQRGPLILTSPHSGRTYPESFLEASRLNKTTLRRSEDFHVDLLFADAPQNGVPIIQAEFPRAFVDVNRSARELDPLMFDTLLDMPVDVKSKRVQNGLGVIARVVGAGVDIYDKPLPAHKATSRIEQYHRPYHRLVQSYIAETAALFGMTVLLDCHSMPSAVTRRNGRFSRSIDVVLGDRNGTSAGRQVVETAERLLKNIGLRVVRNDPYAGGYTTATYGRPALHHHCLQIELNRGLYMDERSLKLNDTFDALRQRMAQFVLDMRDFSIDFARTSNDPGETLAAE